MTGSSRRIKRELEAAGVVAVEKVYKGREICGNAPVKGWWFVQGDDPFPHFLGWTVADSIEEIGQRVRLRRLLGELEELLEPVAC